MMGMGQTSGRGSPSTRSVKMPGIASGKSRTSYRQETGKKVSNAQHAADSHSNGDTEHGPSAVQKRRLTSVSRPGRTTGIG